MSARADHLALMMVGQYKRKEKFEMIKLTLKAARVNAGYTQKEAAEKLGVSNVTLCNWEKGVSYPDIQQVQAICELYGVSYDNLIFLPDNML